MHIGYFWRKYAIFIEFPNLLVTWEICKLRGGCERISGFMFLGKSKGRLRKFQELWFLFVWVMESTVLFSSPRGRGSCWRSLIWLPNQGSNQKIVLLPSPITTPIQELYKEKDWVILLKVRELRVFFLERSGPYLLSKILAQGWLEEFNLQIRFKIWSLFLNSDFSIPRPPSDLGVQILSQLIVCSWYWALLCLL